MNLSREKQRELLQYLFDRGPGLVDVQDLEPMADVTANLIYLEGHGLVENKCRNTLGQPLSVWGSRITSQGCDFLADDGGLAAILGVVTIKLHADTLQELLAARIEGTDLPREEKSLLIKHLKSLPETALKAATQKLLEEGLQHLPDAIGWLRKLAGL